jgi:hypothetical protein
VIVQVPLIVAVVEAEEVLPKVTALAGLTIQDTNIKPLSGTADIGTC